MNHILPNRITYVYVLMHVCTEEIIIALQNQNAKANEKEAILFVSLLLKSSFASFFNAFQCFSVTSHLKTFLVY